MSGRNNNIRSVLALSMLYALLACSSPNSSGDTDSKTTKKDLDGVKPQKGVTGVLVDQKKRPIANSMVQAFLGNDGSQKVSAKLGGLASVTGEVTDSVATDSSGRYAFETLPAGHYNLQGNFQNGSLVVLIRDIEYGGGDALLEVPTDTLRAPGKISGRALLLGQDNGGIICYVPGTSFLALTDDSGSFVLSNIPQGKYTLAYRKEGWKTAKDTGVIVISGKTTVLPTKNLEADPAFPPPAPSNLRVVYDTITGISTLRWKPVSVSDLAGYVIFANDLKDPVPTRLNSVLITDTVFVDSFQRRKISSSDSAKIANHMDTGSADVTYRIKSQDLEANLSTNFSIPVDVSRPNPNSIRTLFTFNFLNTKGDGSFNQLQNPAGFLGAIQAGKSDSASINDTVAIIASYSNRRRENKSIRWFLDEKKSSIQTRSLTSNSGQDTLLQSWKAFGSHILFVSVTDDGGSTWWDSIPIKVVQDPPKASAGKDTAVSINDSIFLRGSASDLFGRIVLREWSIGGNPFVPTDKFDTTIIAPAIENLSYPIFFRATDDDGNVVSDTAYIKVESDLPIAKISGSSPTAKVNVPTLFTSNVTQKFGSVVMYKWDNGKSSGWDDSSATLSQLSYTFQARGTYPIRLYVRDDDGKTDSTTFSFSVSNDNPVLSGSMKDTTISIKDMVKFRVTAADPEGIKWYLWDYNGDGVIDDTSATGIHDHVFPAAAQVLKVIVVVVDNYDGSTKDTAIVSIIQDLPIVKLGKDTAVFINNSILVKGSYSDKYGQIVLMEWSIGGGAFIRASSPESLLFAPSTPNLNYPIILRVTDDDGNVVSDTLMLRVRKISKISGGDNHSLILTSDGILLGTGKSAAGQLGDVTIPNPTTYVSIMTGVANMSAGINHTLILKTDGTLWATGYNTYGQLGDGTTTNRSTPVQIMTGVANMSAGGYHTLILKTDGTLWATGANTNGQLGDGTTTNRLVPVQIMTGVANMFAGGYHTLILKTDGTLWATGTNGSGQLGDGTNFDRFTPVKTMAKIPF